MLLSLARRYECTYRRNDLFGRGQNSCDVSVSVLRFALDAIEASESHQWQPGSTDSPSGCYILKQRNRNRCPIGTDARPHDKSEGEQISCQSTIYEHLSYPFPRPIEESHSPIVSRNMAQGKDNTLRVAILGCGRCNKSPHQEKPF